MVATFERYDSFALSNNSFLQIQTTHHCFRDIQLSKHGTNMEMTRDGTSLPMIKMEI